MRQSSQFHIIWQLAAVALLGALLAACGGAAADAESAEAGITGLPTATASDTPSPSPSATATPTETPTPTDTSTPTITPTWSILRGRVTAERLSCRFGPGAMYLYKTALLETAAVEIVGRTDTGAWILTQAPGGTSRCWVNAAFVDIDGDVLSVEPVDVHSSFVWSPYYGALNGIISFRVGDTVTVRWNALELRAGDDSEQVPYVLEAWVCVDGVITFTPIGSYRNEAQVEDQDGCDEPSYGRVLAAEKHGYTPWIEVDWPSYEEQATQTPTP